MEQWLESVYSDGTECFVSNPQPEMFETVTIWIRLYEDAPVGHVFLRTVPNGAERLIEAKKRKIKGGLAYYAAELKITEERMQYHFYLVCSQVIYYYNQREITTYIPDQTYDFVLLATYRQPAWVKNAVFYQIFPERFYNGNLDNDVKNGEYSYEGHETIQVKDWESAPLPYEKGYALDFFGGDLEGVRQKIPYLKDLGVTAVYLNPIFCAPTVHKYDCIDYFHVDKHFGGDEALAELSKALHENDMKLILDISINHTGAAHKWFNKENDFFDSSQGAYQNPDAKERDYYFFKKDSNQYTCWCNVETLPVLNYQSEDLRQIIYRGENAVLRKWLKPPYSIDGWRFDVADVFARNNEIQLAHEVWTEIRKCIRQENPEAYILAEDWGDCAGYLQGSEWDSSMNYFGCGRVLRQFLGLPDLFLERNEILKKVPYKMTAEDVKNRILQHLAKLPYVLWQNQFNLLDSHDVPRVHNYEMVNRKEYRGAVILQFMLIGAPSIYYGDEVGIDGGTDACDETYRYPMPWTKSFCSNDTYQFYQKLAYMKKEHKALGEGGMKFLYAEGEIIALARFYEEEIFIAVLSVSDKEQEIRLPIGSVGVAYFKMDKDVFGKEMSYQRLDEKSIRMKVEPHQAYLLECTSEE
ncbi:MAG: alpha-amylase family glycosyl hydrolase [Blautia sp.]|nr:alpha-amylase family glycosyl hydrolase [Lachnoclostridium sp.]MCM1210752.1 alpha-amylase family glycosyl hydrolase [Blautia sp.]